MVVQTDMEEAKNQEITKLQAALQDQLSQAQKANSQLTKELEDNRVALGQAAQVIKEVPPVEVFDAKVKKLTEDNEELQVRCAESTYDRSRLAALLCCVMAAMLDNCVWVAMTNRSNVLGRDIYPMAARCVVCAGPPEVVGKEGVGGRGELCASQTRKRGETKKSRASGSQDYRNTGGSA